jgi:hypothetical protein
MASHLKIGRSKFRLELLAEALHELKRTREIIGELESVKLTEHPNCEAMLLPLKTYSMDDEHGLVDVEIIKITSDVGGLEYHLGEDESINQIYLVM